MKRPALRILFLIVLVTVFLLSCGDDDKGTNGANDDTVAPAAISDLSVTAPECGIVQLIWTATGDDGTAGVATKYDARYSREEITAANFDQATQLPGEPAPAAAGETQSLIGRGFESGKTYYFAIKVVDDAMNESGLSNIAEKAASELPDRGILLIDRSGYIYASPGQIWGDCGTCCEYGGDLMTERYHPYFRSLFVQAGSPIDSLYRVRPGDVQDIPPDLDFLAHYQLVIYLTETLYSTYQIEKPWFDRLTEYADEGGKVLLIGRDILATAYDGDPATFQFLPGDIRYDYFGASSEYSPNWIETWLSATITCELSYSNDEFIGAEPIDPSFPAIHASFEHLQEYLGMYMKEGCDGEPFNHDPWCHSEIAAFTPYPYRGVPEVNYFTISDGAEPLYTAISVDGDEGVINGKVCSFRYQTDCFKTAVLGIPLYALEEADAVAMLNAIIDWYDID